MKPPEIVVKIKQANGESSPAASSIDSSPSRPLRRHLRESSYDFDGGQQTANSSFSSGSCVGNGDFSFQRTTSGEVATASMGSLLGPSIADPPSRLISHFLEQQRVSGEMTLDMDMEMDELRQQTRRTAGLPPLPPEKPTLAPSPRSVFNDGAVSRVSIKDQQRQHSITHRRSTDYNDLGELSSSSSDSDPGEETTEDNAYISSTGDELRSRKFQSYTDSAEVVRCTSNAAYDRVPTLPRNKTMRSRLMDPPSSELKSGRFSTKSGPIRSGFLGKPSGSGDHEDDQEQEDDPFFDEDIPNHYKKERLGCCVVLEWISLVLIIVALLCSLLVPDLRNTRLWKLKLWKWDVVVLVLICGRLVSGWGMRLLVFVFERNFMLRKRILYFVYGLRNAVRNCIWLGLVLLTWHFLFDRSIEDQQYVNVNLLTYVTKVLVCCLVGSGLWLVKTLIVKVLASSFHVNAFFDRIQETLFNQYVIETLSGPPLFELRRVEDEMAMADIQRFQSSGAMFSFELKGNMCRSKSGRSNINMTSGQLGRSSVGSLRISGPLSNKQENKGITIDHLHKLNQKNVSAWNMKRLMNIARRGALTTLDEQIVNSAHEDESARQIRSEVEAKAAARKIFRNVARPGTRFIYFEDLLRFMQQDEAMKTLGLFEGAQENERISKSSLKNWLVNAFRGRRALALTINDTKTAVNKLHRIVNVIVCIIISFISLIILNIASTKFLFLVSSQVLVVAFIFGNFCKNVFESIIFLFVVHPYDVGDRCEIDGVQMVVEEMNILTTVFLRYDNQKIIFPNYILLTKPIGNFYRSPDMGDAVEFCFHILTPPEKISLARQRILSYIENKKEHWYANPMIILKDMDSFYTLRIAIWLQHKMNHQDMGERWGRRALLVEECVKVFRDLDIEYRVLPWNINVRSMPPLLFENGPPNLSNDATPTRWNTSSEGGRDVVHR